MLTEKGLSITDQLVYTRSIVTHSIASFSCTARCLVVWPRINVPIGRDHTGRSSALYFASDRALIDI